MILREIKYNVFFEYIKDIRRYNYDIEDFLKNNNLCSNIDFIPPLPDEIEPLAERLSIQKRLDNKLFIFKLSQLSFSIIIIYDENQKIILKDELDYVNNIQERIKNFLKEKNCPYRAVLPIKFILYFYNNARSKCTYPPSTYNNCPVV